MSMVNNPNVGPRTLLREIGNQLELTKARYEKSMRDTAKIVSEMTTRFEGSDDNEIDLMRVCRWTCVAVGLAAV